MRNAQGAAIVEWARQADAAGVEYWLFGGWAVEYHAGQVTRPHHDIDFGIWARDHATMIEMRHAADFEPSRPPPSFIRNGVEFEITLIDSAQGGAIVTPGFEDLPRDAGTFGNDVRALDGYLVRAVSVAGLLAVKTGWEAHFGEPPRPQDLADAQLLQQLQTSD